MTFRTVPPYLCRWLAVLSVLLAQPLMAGDTPDVSGRILFSGIAALDGNSPPEYPQSIGRIILDTQDPTWGIHIWLEGGWDGREDFAPDEIHYRTNNNVYQSASPFVEFKEAYGRISTPNLELRAGIQRFAWGRLDEYPINDLLNPWDHTQFLNVPLEERKLGIPALSASFDESIWGVDFVWVPGVVPYRLPHPDERWAGWTPLRELATQSDVILEFDDAEIPSHRLANSSYGFRFRRAGDVELAVTVFHGYDPHPMVKTDKLVIRRKHGAIYVNPGYAPDFNRMTSIGVDGATVLGNWSLRAEGAYRLDKHFVIRPDSWGYPSWAWPGKYSLNDASCPSDALEYGAGLDYRLMEDCLLTTQIQQTVILDHIAAMADDRIETLFWASITRWWIQHRLETSASVAINPEHGDSMSKISTWYSWTDRWKTGITLLDFQGPRNSLFGRFDQNDQIEFACVYSW